jgi:hypothetical protein
VIVIPAIRGNTATVMDTATVTDMVTATVMDMDLCVVTDLVAAKALGAGTT